MWTFYPSAPKNQKYVRKYNPLAVKVVPLQTSLFNLRRTWMPCTDVLRDMNKNFVPKENVLTKTTLQFKSVVLLEVCGNQRCRELIQAYLKKKDWFVLSAKPVFVHLPALRTYLCYGRILNWLSKEWGQKTKTYRLCRSAPFTRRSIVFGWRDFAVLSIFTTGNHQLSSRAMRYRKLRTSRLDKNFTAASTLSCRSLKSARKEMYLVVFNF